MYTFNLLKYPRVPRMLPQEHAYYDGNRTAALIMADYQIMSFRYPDNCLTVGILPHDMSSPATQVDLGAREPEYIAGFAARVWGTGAE